MINTIIVIFKIVFSLGLLITIHEFAHFAVAKLCKVYVKEFSIGFGPLLWSKQGKETKYEIRLIPLGGYVSMFEEEQDDLKENSLNNVSIPKRIAILAAGGLMNILFGLVVYFILVANMSNCAYAFDATKNFLFGIFESLKLLFTGGVGLDQFIGPIGISDMVSETTKLADFIRNYQFTTISTTRWRKNFILYNRGNKKKTNKRRNTNTDTIIRFCCINHTINIYYL